MSKISQLAGKGKTVNVGGVELFLEPLSVKDMDLMVKLEDTSKMEWAMKEVIKRTLKKSDEEITEEEINNISIDNMKDLMEKIMELNGLSEEKAPRKFIEKMKKAQPGNV